jgi:peptide/nickel transport system substrate-binding protein
MHYRRALAAMGVAMLVAACGQSAQPTPTASGGAAATATAAARGTGGDLKILYWQPPTILNAHQATGTKDADATRLVMEPMASFGKDGLPVANGLAAEIPTPANNGVSKDFKTVTWKLRTGVKWSDGTPFKASDVAFTYKYQCTKETAASTFDRCDNVDSVVAKDDTTVVVTYKEAQPFYYQWGVGGGSLILQEAQYKNCVGAAAKNCPADQKPIGTGAYMVDTFKPGDTVTYVMNPNFRDATKPYFKSVTFKGGGDATAAARAAFQTGDVDYAWNLQVEASVLNGMAKASDAKATLVTVYGSSVERILVNFSDPSASLGDKRGEPDTKHPFFSDKAVRRALAMATDRATMAEQLYGGGLSGKATCNILTAPEPMNSKASASFDICKFDLAAANAELDKAGWAKGSDGVRAKGGVKLEITYSTTVNPLRQKEQDIAKAGWEKAGFKVNLKSVDAGVFFTNTSPDGANHFWTDVEMFTNSGDPDPTSYFNGWTSAQATSKANNWQFGNYSRYQNPAFDAIVDQLRKETDQAKRNDLATKANDTLIQDVVIIPLINRTFATSGVSKTLKGVDPTPWDSEMWNIASWSK